MINANVFLKLPIEFLEEIYIYPPSVEDVIKEKNFYKFLQVLTFSQEEIEDLFTEENKNGNRNLNERFPTPFEFLLINCSNSSLYERIVQDAFKFFLKKEIVFLYDRKSILIGSLEEQLLKINGLNELILIDENNFFDFQNLIRESSGLKKVEKPILDEHPRIRQMKAKARYRDKILAKQRLKDGVSLGTTLAAVCCMNMGLNPLNIGQVSYSAISDLSKIFQQKESYEMDVRSILAGADSKKIKPKYWIREDKEEK